MTIIVARVELLIINELYHNGNLSPIIVLLYFRVSETTVLLSLADSKKKWFYNGFTAAGLILIIYSSSMEIQGKGAMMHEFAIPVVHIAEAAVVLWVANKMIKYDEQEKLRFIELSHFPSTVDGSI